MKIILALDYEDPQQAIDIANKVQGQVDGFKVNHLLWDHTDSIRDLADELFIDCKLWDTPHTVKQVVQKIVDKGATMTTICTHNNRAVFEELEQFSDQIKLLGVTYLTSWNGSDLLEIMHYVPGGVRVMWRDNIDKIRPYGFAGMICSPKDLEVVNPLTYGMIKVCPGIGANKGQVRTVSAREATDMGADYLVIGRTITNAKDPIRAIEEIKESVI